MSSRAVTIAAVLTITASPASALDQSEHRALAVEACGAAGLPSRFCERVGQEAYNVDYHEWDVMAAHGQPEPGQSLCDAANATAGRVMQLADELSFAMHVPATTNQPLELAKGLGRILHTVQDNCAHAGISNAHHAWLSLQDTCEGSDSSPDHQPEAMQCAIVETKAIMTAFVAELGRAGVVVSTLGTLESTIGLYPPRDGVCEFLRGAEDWDGIDRRWNDTWVTSALRDRFIAGITGDTTALRPACSPGAYELFRPADAPVDVSAGPATCKRVEAFCVGKSDLGDDEPPWAAAEDDEQSVGCSTTGSGSSLGLVVAALMLFVRRRRPHAQ